MITFFKIAPAIVAALTGLVSARLWYSASNVPIAPLWIEFNQMEPVDLAMNHEQRIEGLIKAASKSSDLNAKAARWTAATVILTTISALVSAI